MFDDVRLPVDVERGARGGPRFSTVVTTLLSGAERRLQNWSKSRARWDIGYGVQTRDQYAEIVSFFLQRRGRARGFRFKDWTDFQVSDAEGAYEDDVVSDTLTNTYLAKQYGTGATAFYRRIVRPIQGTVTFSAGAYTVDYTTGIVTPKPAQGVTWSGEFDVPVRFDTDELDLELSWFDGGAIPAIPVIELRT